MAKQNTAPTMKDVAKEAGVSLGTVSKVINGIPVGDEYRKKVEQAIKTLDYHINAYAKGLKNNRTYTVAVILPNLLNPFFSMVAHYINRALVNRGYRMLLCDTEYDYTKEQEMVQMVAQNKVDGIIALTYNPDLKIPPDVRSVSIDRYLSGSTTCVASDNYNGGRLAAQKLVENGCKNLAFLRIGSPLTSETNKRRDGFVAECEAMQLPCTQKILMDDAPLSEFEHFLEENLKDGRLAFDGIFCVTDKLAVAVIKMLRRMGQRVPEDVQVIGYDGLRAFGDQDYYCSTIIQPVEAMAETCVDLVLQDSHANTPSLLCRRCATPTAAPPRHDRPGKRPVVLVQKLAALPLALPYYCGCGALGRHQLAGQRPALGRNPAGLSDRLCGQKCSAGGYSPRHRSRFCAVWRRSERRRNRFGQAQPVCQRH